MKNISELNSIKYGEITHEDVFYIKKESNTIHKITIGDIFNIIKEKAINDNGLIVEQTGDKIIFIKSSE